MAHVIVEKEIGGRTLRLETGKYAKQADAAIWITYAETSVLSAVVRGKPRPGIDFFPLQIDYRERPSAAGKYPGGFRKREGAPNTKEILTMRMIDRPLRPLFPKGLLDEVIVQNWVESADGENDPDVVAGIGAAAAVAISSIPHDGPIATVRVGRIDGKLVVNPTVSELEFSDLELVLSGHRDGVNMIEVGAMEVPEAEVLEAIKFGHEQIQTILDAIDELVEAVKPEKTADLHVPSDELMAEVEKAILDDLKKAKQIEDKQERKAAIDKIFDEYLEENAPEPGEDDDIAYPKFQAVMKKRKDIKNAFHDVEEKVTRQLILEGNREGDRANDELRDIDCEVGVLARAHGSSTFTRGQTQSMVSCTLGVGRDEQIVDGLSEEYSQKFMLHYNFPPFCVGEARRITGPSRREIGHGALAERSLIGVLPSPEDFPYTIRLVSEILESNGSSSMASICGGCLALMDAGVPILNTCAGISIGSVEEDGKRVLLTDILGSEDHFGDMDFKVAGTRNGITGIQLDLKRRGITAELIAETFEAAKTARLKIIDRMESTLATPRPDISKHAPRLLTIKINPEKIGKLIGPGGKTIRDIQERTNATIEVEEDGTVLISSVGEGGEQARSEIEALCEEVKVGKNYTGKVTSVRDFGAFVEVIPGQDGLLHISEISEDYIEKIHDHVSVGDVMTVKVISADEQGRLRLSRKEVLREEEGNGDDGDND